jgi:uncharacterized protein (DUF427 family)
VVVEGNQLLFPTDAVKKQYLKASDPHLDLSLDRGTAHYSRRRMWTAFATTTQHGFYPDPKSEAAKISGRIAFWKGVRVES